MRRRGAIVVALAALALALAGCGGDDEKATTKPAPPDAVEAPRETAPPTSPGELPREFVECMADRGFDVESSADIHSAPPEVLQACFGSLHQGRGGP